MPLGQLRPEAVAAEDGRELKPMVVSRANHGELTGPSSVPSLFCYRTRH